MSKKNGLTTTVQVQLILSIDKINKTQRLACYAITVDKDQADKINKKTEALCIKSCTSPHIVLQ